MNTLIKIVRYHLVDRVQHVLLPSAVTVFAFLANLAIFAAVPAKEAGAFTGGLSTLFVFMGISGAVSATKSLPFGFALGTSRRSYYLGTILLALGLGAAYALGITVFQAIERATGGWGIALHFFRIPGLFDGAWYLTWLTSFSLLVLVFVYGMWCGLVYRRWNLIGLWIFLGAQVTVLLAAALVITGVRVWPEVGESFAALSGFGLIGALASGAVVLALGGFTTMRRVAV